MAIRSTVDRAQPPRRVPRPIGVWRRKVQEQLVGVSFILPAVVLLSLFLLYPIANVVYISFHRWGILGDPQYVGWENYGFLLADPQFGGAILNTIYFVALAVPAQLAFGLLFAVLLNSAIRGRRWFRTIFFIPMAMSLAAAGILFRWLFATAPLPGFVPTLLATIGIEFPAWQSTADEWAMPVVVVMNTWKSTGYAMVIYLAGLQSINPNYYEAAALDGVQSEWQKFRDITWPLLAPTTFLLVVTTTIFSFRAFEPFFVMTNGGPAGATTTLVFYIYEKFPNLMGIASAAATAMLIGVFMLTAVQFLANRRREVYY